MDPRTVGLKTPHGSFVRLFWTPADNWYAAFNQFLFGAVPGNDFHAKAPVKITQSSVE